MKQRKLSNWLKGIVIALGLMGIVFFGGLTIYAYGMYTDDAGYKMYHFIVFSWLTAVLCYGILFQFWKICTQIGRDNSFSMENARHFHTMAFLSGVVVVEYVLRFLWMITIDFQIMYALLILFFLFAFIIFAVLCEALSRLVQNAYEVKLENELTI